MFSPPSSATRLTPRSYERALHLGLKDHRAHHPSLTEKSALLAKKEEGNDEKKGLKREESTISVTSSSSSSSSDEGGEVKKQTTMQTIFNFANIFVGLGLLSKPYALAQGGFMSLAFLLLACLLCAFTAYILKHVVDAYRIKVPGGGVSFAEIARAYLGKGGFWSATVITLLEVGLAGAVALIFVWNNMIYLMPLEWQQNSMVYYLVAGISTICVLPTVWVKSFSNLSFIALLGAGASLGIALLVTVLLFFYLDVIPENHYSLIQGETFALAAGIYLTSLGGHALIPTLYVEMKNPKKFPLVIVVSFAVIFLIYSAMATSGYLLFGNNASVLITENLRETPGGAVDVVAVTCVIISSFCSIAPFITVLSNAMEQFVSHFRPDIKKASPKRWSFIQRLLRTAATLLVFVIALGGRPFLAAVEAIGGGLCTIFNSIVFPSLFAAMVYWPSKGKRTGFLFLSTLGTLIGVAMTVLSVVDYADASPSENTTSLQLLAPQIWVH